MSVRTAYQPRFDQTHPRAFDQFLSHCRGSWTHKRSFVHAGDPRIIRLRWLIPDARWCNEDGYLEFLDQYYHRSLLRCFVRRSPKRFWSENDLLQLLSPGLSPDDLKAALTFCELQEFLVAHGKIWEPGPYLEAVENFGVTFEWIVQENLQRFHQAIARRSVTFLELEQQQLGDLDVLAFTRTGLVITVECKSSSSGIERSHITRFLHRAAIFPADIALLLIDSIDQQHMKVRLAQIQSCLPAPTPSLQCYSFGGSLVYHLQENIYVAHTGGSIQDILSLVMERGRLACDRQQQQTSHEHPA